MQETYEIVLKIRRYDPDSDRSWIHNYQLETGRILRFTDLFRKINTELDSTLAWNSSCEHGQCGTCSVKINGQPMLACELLVENAVAHFETTEFLIEPLTIAPVVRDLIVDFDKAYERVQKIMMAADTGGCTAEAINTTGCINIALEMAGRNFVFIARVRIFNRLDDIRLDFMDPLVGYVKIYDQIPNHRCNRKRFNQKFIGLEMCNSIFHQQLAGEHWFAVNFHRTGTALSVLTGRIPGQGRIQLFVDFSKQVGKPKNSTGF